MVVHAASRISLPYSYCNSFIWGRMEGSSLLCLILTLPMCFLQNSQYSSLQLVLPLFPKGDIFNEKSAGSQVFNRFANLKKIYEVGHVWLGSAVWLSTSFHTYILSIFWSWQKRENWKASYFIFSIFRGITPYAVKIFSKQVNFGRVIKSSMQNRFDSKKGLIVNWKKIGTQFCWYTKASSQSKWQFWFE